MKVETLEKRLHELDIETPDPGRVSSRVLALQTRRRGGHVPRLVTAPVALVLLVVLVAYFAPAADIAVAEKSPWSGEVLQWAGLVGARDRITAVNVSASSSGYRLTLEGVYADSTRTMLLMHADPAIAAGAGNPAVITDQFARTYQFSGSSSNTLTGDIVMQFGPLAWPDSITGARITLHVSQIEAPSHKSIYGTWELTAALGVDVAKSLPLPGPADLGPAHFRFTTVSYTPATIEVDMEVTGASGDDLWRRIPDGLKGFAALQVDLIDPSGQNIAGNTSESGDQNTSHLRVFGWRTRGGGQYLLRVSYYGYGSFERVLTVPS